MRTSSVVVRPAAIQVALSKGNGLESAAAAELTHILSPRCSLMACCLKYWATDPACTQSGDQLTQARCQLSFGSTLDSRGAKAGSSGLHIHCPRLGAELVQCSANAGSSCHQQLQLSTC